jgi:hypothetical protein
MCAGKERPGRTESRTGGSASRGRWGRVLSGAMHAYTDRLMTAGTPERDDVEESSGAAREMEASRALNERGGAADG